MIDIVGQLLLGLGLFFLGMQQVGDNLRRLSGPSFRTLMARSTGSTAETSLMGLVFGTLMQSATAVTFILVSMVTSGLVVARSALPVIVWCNVGLTVLAFVVSLDIHPLVTYLVGASAILASMVRRPTWRATAGVFLGVALIFFGLETMGQAAHPLVALHSFHSLLEKATSSPAIAFFIGIAVAAVLQSNTASTLLVITLAGAGAFDLGSALMLIYGTNLGAIVLRLILAAELRGTPLQLVHFEDLFCLVSGAIMVALFYAETIFGIPLVQAAIALVTADVKTQLAIAFLLSNLLPAIAMMPVLGQCQSLLARIWPATAEEDEAKPKYINRRALDDPGTALDLLEREIARYLGSIRDMLAIEASDDERTRRFESLGQLATAIGEFVSQLAATSRSPHTNGRLAVLREALAVAGYLRENAFHLCQSLTFLTDHSPLLPAANQVRSTALKLMDATVSAANSHDAAQLQSLEETTRQRGTLLSQIEQTCRQQSAQCSPVEATALERSLDNLKMIAWMLHHLAKLLGGLTPSQTPTDQSVAHPTTRPPG